MPVCTTHLPAAPAGWRNRREDRAVREGDVRAGHIGFWEKPEISTIWTILERPATGM